MFSRFVSSTGGTGAIAGELGVTCSGSGEAGCDFSKLPATGDEAAVPETPIGVFIRRKMTKEKIRRTHTSFAHNTYSIVYSKSGQSGNDHLKPIK